MMPISLLPGGPRGVARLRLGRVALLVSLALSLGLANGVPAATTWTVCASGCDYSSIKAAIAAPTTLNGDTLAIVAGTYTEAGILVNKSLTLQGEDAATTIVQAATTPGTATDRVFSITSGVSVILQNVTIRYGRMNGNGGGLFNAGTLTLTHTTVHGNKVAGYYVGGGLFNAGTLTLTHTTVHSNETTSSSGGGLYNGYGGTLTLTHSTVQDNKAGGVGSGGGLANSGMLTVTHSTISNNAADWGGGFDNGYGTLTLTATTVHSNKAAISAGGLSNAGTLTLIASTINNNAAGYGGGGLYHYTDSTTTLTATTIHSNKAGGDGGGLYNQGRLTLTNSTVSGNTADDRGGGLANFAYSDTLTLLNSTVSGNTASNGGGLYNGGLYNAYTLTLTNSLVADNPHGGDCLNSASNFTSITSQGYNLDSDGSCHLIDPTDLPGTDPRLGPLQDNGGPTFTHALLPGSPALDAIPWGTNGCGTTLYSDQRWQARPQPAGGACDIGAFEVEVAGQALSAWVTGVTPHTSVCENATTGQAVTLSNPVSPWDCKAAGLGVMPGDQVALRVRGPVKKNATDVGGAVAGMTPSGGGCTNRTTGQQVKFQALFQGEPGATAASCVAAGLIVQPGEVLQMRVQGVAE